VPCNRFPPISTRRPASTARRAGNSSNRSRCLPSSRHWCPRSSCRSSGRSISST